MASLRLLLPLFLLQFFNIPSGDAIIFYVPEIDHIEVVTSDNFTSVVFLAEHLTIMKFYAHWCGYSKRFIPHWKDFANETILWHKNVLRVASIDCANAQNHDICQKNQVYEYPVFRFFPAYGTLERGITAENETSRSEKFMRRAIYFLETQEKPPKTWPDLAPYRYKNHLFF